MKKTLPLFGDRENFLVGRGLPLMVHKNPKANHPEMCSSPCKYWDFNIPFPSTGELIPGFLVAIPSKASHSGGPPKSTAQTQMAQTPRLPA